MGWLWAVRGVIDLLVGGPGTRRGRRQSVDLRVGDPVDSWRVDRYEPDRPLRLRAEMRLPGQAWLEWRAEPDGQESRLVQQARSHPHGLLGWLYWCALVPAHAVVLGRMARGLVTAASDGRHGPPWTSTVNTRLLLGAPAAQLRRTLAKICHASNDFATRLSRM